MERVEIRCSLTFEIDRIVTNGLTLLTDLLVAPTHGGDAQQRRGLHALRSTVQQPQAAQRPRL